MQQNRDRVRIISEQLLSDNWYTLKKYTFSLLRRDGQWQEQSREAYDRGNGAVVLLYNRDKKSVVLTRQFRFPIYLNGHDGFLIEAAAGLLDNASPETRIVAEAEEETGFRVTRVEKVFEAFMSPGSVTEKLYFFIAEYADQQRNGEGGGIAEEGEDIEVLEMDFDQALQAITDGDIMDAKTIMLLQHLRLKGIL
ncbi:MULTISPECIES: NUDIX domain-containing protein [Pantoea]|jgi:nudix-type nucleoside diphosphatase (YffH/AdpP family)|uniref:GDP-mannose pyrophosphatase n=1 Tax=Pantoea brenneri TaxID=472694 RepID=A0A654AJ50_9GAMM|nr:MULTISPECIES: NUDIX domain-containing protein [Pantoea]KKD33320.1 GDP-mannose pyrophosphatase [Pantoea sp. 3.5.1]MBS6031706.1 NUDIX domain-containing protein [Pantoea sp.]MBZ6393609.1 NUDIX domain-containing protein [Pantoea sp.]MBZ6437408.1 NUDIX domain-containing protein [Pantoea sp.]MDH1086473.1 NUDIX domain-containing protein [Pantoea brenneri]